MSPVLCLRSSSQHPSPSIPPRLRPHHSAVRRWEGLLHPLCPDRSPLHHAGAHRLRPAAHAASGPRPRRPPAAPGSAASAGHRAPLHAAAGPGSAVLLCGAGRRVQQARGFLVVPGRRLLLLHLAVHHRLGRLCPRDTAQAEAPVAVPALRHV